MARRRRKKKIELKHVVLILLFVGGIIHFTGFQLFALVEAETGTSIRGLQLDTTKRIVNPGDNIGVNVYGGDNDAFPSAGGWWGPIAGGCGSAYTMQCFLRYREPAGTMRIYIDDVNGNKLLLHEEHVRAYAPKWKRTSCNQYGCSGTHLTGHVFGFNSYDRGYNWHNSDGERFYDVIIPGSEGLAVSPVLGNSNITVTFEEDFCTEYDCSVCDPNSGVSPGDEVANEHAMCYGGCSFCGYDGDKINGNKVVDPDTMLIFKDKSALTIDYDTGDEWMQDLSGEFLVAKGQVRVEPPKCEFDPITEVLVHEVFFSGQTIDGNKLRYNPARICANPSPTLLRADAGLAYDSYEPIQFPYYVPPSHLAELHYVATSQDVFGTEKVPVNCTEGSWSANHEECRVTTLIRPCPPDMIFTEDGTCIVVSPENCPPGSYWDEELKKCAFDVCIQISDTAKWISEFKQCGEQLPFPTVCTYDIGEEYEWSKDMCVLNLGDYNPDWDSSNELMQGWEQGNSTCTENGGELVEEQVDSMTVSAVCLLEPNPIIPDGSFYKQGDDKCWAVYGATFTELEGVSCPEGTLFDTEAGKCVVEEIQYVEKFTYKELEYQYEITTLSYQKLFNKYLVEILFIMGGIGVLYILYRRRR